LPGRRLLRARSRRGRPRARHGRGLAPVAREGGLSMPARLALALVLAAAPVAGALDGTGVARGGGGAAAARGAGAAVGEAGSSDPGHAAAPGQLEGRPPAAQASPLQARIDAAPAGATLVVESGEYVGDLVVDRPLTLVGRGRPRLVGSGSGSVVRVRAGDV